MCCKDAVLLERLLINCTINCLSYGENTRQPYNDNLCLFFEHGNQWLEDQNSKIFNSFISRLDKLSPNQFKRVHMNDIPLVKELRTPNIVLYDIYNENGNIIRELGRRSVQKYEFTVKLLRYNSHICYVSNNSAVFQSYGHFKCDTFSDRTLNLERCSKICIERVKNVHPRNRYQIGETLFYKLDIWY